MGIFDGLFGGGDRSTTVTNAIPKWMEGAGEDLWKKAWGAAGKSPQTYGGQRVAGFSPDQQTAFDAIRSRVTNNPASPFMGGAQDMRMKAMGMSWPTAANDYMNPFEDQVVGQLQKDMGRQRAIDRQGINDAATAAKAFGGDRHGLVEAEYDRNYQDRMASAIGQLRRQGYTDAAGIFTQDMLRKQQAANDVTNAAVAENNMTVGNIDALGRSGSAQQEQRQRLLDVPYQDFLYKRDYPFETSNFLGGILAGVPYSQTSTQTQPGANPWASALGLGMSAVGTAGMLGWRPFK